MVVVVTVRRAGCPELRPTWRVAALSCALAASACSAYDPDLLDEPPGNPLTRQDGGSDGMDAGAPVSSCRGASHLAPCEAENADAVCVDGVCQVVRCRERYVDCDGDADNGCEATLDSPEHCGACGAPCTLAHVARYRCESADEGVGRCSIDRSCPDGEGSDDCGGQGEPGCEPGYGDCDGLPGNGCETRLDTLANCGGCGDACSVSGAQASCEEGECQAIGCAPGSGDCAGDGCAPLSDDTSNCGSCGNACDAATPACAGGRCTAQSCEAGSADCDGESDNGCETDLTTTSDCGSCGIACEALPNAQVACDEGRCVVGACDAGHADCDGDPRNGCETDLASDAACGACNNPCAALPNVESARCEGGTCGVVECASGFGDCDGDPDNGCEQSLHTLAHCGACDAACDPPHATGECMGGSCMIVACEEGMDECNGVVEDGCEADLASASTCGGCNNVCPEGARCAAGGCTCVSDDDCDNGLTCCDGACIDTDSHCVWWPCIPGTSRNPNHCGGCNDRCLRTACCAN